MSRAITAIKRSLFFSGAFLSRNMLFLIIGLLLIVSNPANAQDQEKPSTETTAETMPASDQDEWNWDDFEADDTPVTSNQVIQREAPSRRLSIDEVTAPDLDAEPHQVYPLFQNIPSFEVIASKKDVEMHPCSNCHQAVKSNLTPRKLDIPHTNFELKHGLHGKGQFWCFTCHSPDGTGSLRTLDGESVEFRDAYIICSQCHVNQARDWAFGAHGKRVGNWKGQRQVYNCTICHYQHSPAFKPRDALAGPEIRQGLERPAHWFPGQHNTIRHDTHGVKWRNRHE